MDSSSAFLSLLSPMVLAFLLGIIAAQLKSDLKFPHSMYQSPTIFLLIAIGLKKGYKLQISHGRVFNRCNGCSLSSFSLIWFMHLFKKIKKIKNLSRVIPNYEFQTFLM
jgi:hypothetical protein